MKFNIESLDSPCTGCGACRLVCPVQAINIKKNDYGFYNAFVDTDMCIGCKKCLSVCLKNGVVDAVELRDGEIFSAQSVNKDVVASSSSGGIAHELSIYALQKGYYVAGAKYDYDTNTVKTILINNLEKLEELQGSKYLQSKVDDAFFEICENAKSNPSSRFIVFGTPCQIYGLATVLEKLGYRDRAILVDFFCHGVPSYNVWDNYLESIRSVVGNSRLKKVTFRDKKIGWHNFVMRIEGKNGLYQKTSEADWFFKLFFDNVMLSKSCFNCSTRQSKSKADIRLGDCWGKRYQDREDGISAVLCLTERGRTIINELEDIIILDRLNIDEVLAAQSVKQYNEEALHDVAFSYFAECNDLKKTAKYYRKQFAVKRRIKLLLKEGTSYLPDGIRARIRRIYKTL